MRLCLVGSGPRADQLRNLVSRLGIDPQVTWAGQRARRTESLAAFDVVVVCSRWEGLPLVALEALAAEVPLVATAVGGRPGPALRRGWLPVDSPDAGLLASSIAAVMDDPGEARARAHKDCA